LDLFVVNIKGGNETLVLNANVSIVGNLTVDTNTLVVDDVNNRVGIGTTTPSQTLVVVGTVNITDSLNVSGTVEAARFVGDGSLLTGIIGAGPWNASGTNVFLNDSNANVGIGTANPSQALEVVGYINVTGTSTSNSTFEGDVKVKGTLYAIKEISSTGNVTIGSGSNKFFLCGNSTSGFFEMRDDDDAGWTRCSVLNGVLSCRVGVGSCS